MMLVGGTAFGEIGFGVVKFTTWRILKTDFEAQIFGAWHRRHHPFVGLRILHFIRSKCLSKLRGKFCHDITTSTGNFQFFPPASEQPLCIYIFLDNTWETLYNSRQSCPPQTPPHPLPNTRRTSPRKNTTEKNITATSPSWKRTKSSRAKSMKRGRNLHLSIERWEWG